MKLLSILVFTSLGAVWAQTAPPSGQALLPDIPGDKVIAHFDDGTDFTMEQLRQLYPVLPPQLQSAVTKDPVEFFHEYALMRRFTKMAEEQKLNEQEPYKNALAFNRMFILFQAVLDRAFRDAVVQPVEVVNYYDSHKELYRQVRVKAIYLPFSDAPSITDMTEEQAKAKAAKLVADARAGADFVKLVKENSQDETSRAKEGEFATLGPSDNIPDVIKTAVLALKQGDVSDPVRQPRGFYIFRAEEVTYPPLSKVRDQIFMKLKTERGQAWETKMDKETKVEFPDPAFPPKKAPAPAPAK
ncbi:MAG TPA: peptidylprolyl isomerase [Bryobacteraceae bacterium]|nr:peptidylprolyl isomerase [Bryobacteraceae bacterium]